MKNNYKKVLGSIEGKRRGITTGTCAQAAAKAAVLFLVSGKKPEYITIKLPPGKKALSGKRIDIPVAMLKQDGNGVIAGIIKDAGDDEDITNGALICAKVVLKDTLGIVIKGGKGVGIISKTGLRGQIGESAINPVPKRMIAADTASVLPENRGANITIFVPEGEKLAEKTWNSRIGIVGGISIIGTSGIVEPKSSNAFKTSIAVMIKAASAQNRKRIIITPGYVGEKYLYNVLCVKKEDVLTVGDFIGFSIDQCKTRGIEKIVLAGHIGKLVKIAAGIFNTHSKFGDARLETIAAYSAACGANSSFVRDILNLKLAEAAIPLLDKAGLNEVYKMICTKIIERCNDRTRSNICEGCILLSLKGRVLVSIPEKIL